MSEHTAEYALVPDLARRLAPAFPEAIPVFFWSTQEGNLTAVESMSGLTFRVVSCFARRPKIDNHTDNHIVMKVNRQLLDYCRVSSSVGIPVLAGVPMVKSLRQLRVTSHCCWFNLIDFADLDDELYIELTLDGSVVGIHGSKRRSAVTLNDNEIRTVVKLSPILTWECATERFRDIRRTTALPRAEEYGHVRFPFFGGYKPFHLILPTS